MPELSIDGLKVERSDGQLVKFQAQIPVWKRGEKVELFVIGAPAKVEISGPCILKARFGFGDVHTLAGKPVIPALNEMGVLCQQIVANLEAAANQP